jgi:hypothetical protein
MQPVFAIHLPRQQAVTGQVGFRELAAFDPSLSAASLQLRTPDQHPAFGSCGASRPKLILILAAQTVFAKLLTDSL